MVAVATAAPAFAASPCTTPVPGSMDWNVPRFYRQGQGNKWIDRGYGYSRSSSSSADYLTQDPDGTGPQLPLALTISVSYGSNTQAAADQLTVSTTNVGGTGDVGLTLHQTPRDTALTSSSLTDRNKSIVTFAFGRVVSELTFTMTDIDSASADFRDAVGIAGAVISSSSIANTSLVQGTGTVTDPFQVRTSNSAVDNEVGSGGNVTVTLKNFSSFDLHYWNTQAAGSGGDQKVFLTDFELTYFACD